MNHLWQSTLFAAAAGLLTLALRRNRAQVRYWLWFSASIKFLIPFALLMSLGNLLPAPKPSRSIAPPAVTLAVEQIALPFSDTPPPALPAKTSRDWLPIVWACGFLAAASVRLRGWLRVRAAVRASTPLDLAAGVAVRSSASLLEPGVVGIWRPILLVPAGIEQRLTPSQLQAVLAHEMCHVRRRDNLFAAVHMVVEALFWCHPLVWWIGARLIAERERACDEEVLRQGSEPDVYAEAILNVCKLYKESPLVCVSGVTGSDLKKRIEAIMRNRMAPRLNLAKKAALAVAATIALAAPILVGVMKTPVLRAQSTPKFEVASIKPCTLDTFAPSGGGRKGGGPSASPGRLSTGCTTVADFIRSAYISYASGRLSRDPSNPKLQGGPDWIQAERYVIDAKAEDAQSQGMMMGPMLQTLLEDRLKVKVHRESREEPVYRLTVAKDGPKLTPFRPGSCTPIEFGTVPRLADGCNDTIGLNSSGRVAVNADALSVAGFSKLLFLAMDRPVVDETGISGLFDFHFEFGITENTPILDPKGEPAFPASADDPAGPSIFVVLQRQLGLKLEQGKGPRPFVVVDHVEPPTEN